MEDRDATQYATQSETAAMQATTSIESGRIGAYSPAPQANMHVAQSPLPPPVSSQQHYYPQTNGHQQNQPLSAAAPQHSQPQHEYRVSQNGMAPVSLPPIQHFEPAQSAVQPTQPHFAHMNGAEAQHQMIQHAPSQAQVAYQYQPGAMPAMMPSNGQVMYTGRDGYNDRRYTPPPLHPFPGHALPHVQLDPRQMSGGRHKKEIKRRTKTGCLTCRKRRIKCDERHPACQNCAKSKRECLGYDPIFKQQPGPAPIQPAPRGINTKPDGTVPLQYSQQQFPGSEDMYNSVRSQPPSLANGTYPGHSYPQQQMGNPPNGPIPQHYHPPFDPSHKGEAQISKA